MVPPVLLLRLRPSRFESSAQLNAGRPVRTVPSALPHALSARYAGLPRAPTCLLSNFPSLCLALVRRRRRRDETFFSLPLASSQVLLPPVPPSNARAAKLSVESCVLAVRPSLIRFACSFFLCWLVVLVLVESKKVTTGREKGAAISPLLPLYLAALNWEGKVRKRCC